MRDGVFEEILSGRVTRQSAFQLNLSTFCQYSTSKQSERGGSGARVYGYSTSTHSERRGITRHVLANPTVRS